jgi:hypothetical protein
MRDDRVLRGTRVLGAVIVPFLLVAFGWLYLFPDDTRHWFAWDVQPTITPLLMGAGYVAGAYFFVRVARETRWHRIQVGFVPVTGFTLFMAIGTFNHLDRFDAQHVAFWIWVGLYVTTRCLCRWPGGATARLTRGRLSPGEAALFRFARPTLLIAGGVAVGDRAGAAALALDDDRALAVDADAADGADARRVVCAAGRDGADDGPQWGVGARSGSRCKAS